jgi:protein-disulfide isomerase
MEEKKSEAKKEEKRPEMGVPVAIVIAGALIAGAIYWGAKGGEKTVVVEEQPVAQEQEQEKDVAGMAVGDIREIGRDDYVRGAADPKVTIVEYSDTECPFCKNFHATVAKVAEEYPNDVSWVYRHFPLDQLHSKARKEAEATECAGEQGKFWEMLDLIYEVTPSNDGLDLAQLPQLARQAGVANIGEFNSCLESGKYSDKVASDLADAQAAGGRGTPYSVLIGPDGSKTPMSGAQPYESVKAKIDELL